MTWRVFLEVNKELFAFARGSWRTTFWKLASGIVAVAGVAGAYWMALDGIVHWVIVKLVPGNAELLNKAWDAAPHYGLRTLVALILLALVYTAAFALTAQERLDYRARMARALGIKFLNVRREHEVIDLTGRCRAITIEQLEVYDLRLSHIQRRLQVPSVKNRTVPDILVEGLPEGVRCTPSHKDDDGLRVFVLNFFPPLSATINPVRIKIEETFDNGISMFEQETRPADVFGNARVEFISYFVVEPVARLELTVTFPYGYQVGGQTQVGVRYGRTPTVHDAEEQRLKKSNAVYGENRGGHQTLKLVVDEPIFGLHYYLHWVPPQKPQA